MYPGQSSFCCAGLNTIQKYSYPIHLDCYRQTIDGVWKH